MSVPMAYYMQFILCFLFLPGNEVFLTVTLYALVSRKRLSVWATSSTGKAF